MMRQELEEKLPTMTQAQLIDTVEDLPRHDRTVGERPLRRGAEA